MLIITHGFGIRKWEVMVDFVESINNKLKIYEKETVHCPANAGTMDLSLHFFIYFLFPG